MVDDSDNEGNDEQTVLEDPVGFQPLSCGDVIRQHTAYDGQQVRDSPSVRHYLH